MSTKDFKFNDDAFDDVFSSSKSDEFEDVYSDNTNELNKINNNDIQNNTDGFEDVFSGSDEPDEYDSLLNEYFVEKPVAKREADEYRQSVEQLRPSENRKPVNTNVEKKPYSYNYSKSSQNKARKVTQNRHYDDVSEEVFSGKQVKDKMPKKKVKAGKVVAIILAVIILLVGVLGVGGFSYVKSLTKKVNYKPLDPNNFIASSSLLSKKGVSNILLVGVDAREGQSNNETRSDTMMLLSIDTNNKQLKLTSFLRDTYIEIPDYKWAKLNAAQSHGGTQLLVDTLEYNYHVNIDNYMLVNFDMFTTIIDSLDGVDVEVTEKEAKYINSKDHMSNVDGQYFPEDIVAGPSVHLTGHQALWYARIRYLDNDYMRTQRQRKVIKAIVEKAKKTSPTKLFDMLNKIIPMVESDLEPDDMMNIGKSALTYLKYDIAQQQIPAADTFKSGTKSGQSVLLMDLDKNREILKDFVFEKAVIEEKTTAKS